MASPTGIRPTQFRIGAHVACVDGAVGVVSRVVINPITRSVTHLVIEPSHGPDGPRLVGLDLVEEDGDELRLTCTLNDFAGLDPAEEMQFLPSSEPYADYPEGAAVFWPYYGLGIGYGNGMAMDSGILRGPPPHAVSHDVVPAGEVVVHRGDRVSSVDGEIGRVQGVVIAADGHTVTHVLLQEGHLFTKKDVAIPISAVTSFAAGITLDLTREQIEDLPATDVHSHAG